MRISRLASLAIILFASVYTFAQSPTTAKGGYIQKDYISIGDTSPASASAALDVKSTTKGALLPRQTTTQRNSIGSPPTGLLLYNITNLHLNSYDGSFWTDTIDTHYTLGNSKALIIDDTGYASTSQTSADALYYLRNASSDVQNQLDFKIPFSTSLAINRAMFNDSAGYASSSVTTSTQLGYLSNLSQDLQTSLNQKISSSALTTKGDILTTDGILTQRFGVVTDGYVLTSSSAFSTGLVWSPATNGFTNPMTASGSLIYGGSSGTPLELLIGNETRVLTVSGGLPVWASSTGGSGGTSVDTVWIAYTPTGSWSSNTTYTGYWRRIGDSLQFRITLSLTGAPTSATLTVNIFQGLSGGLTIDTAKLPSTSNYQILGVGSGISGGTSVGHFVSYNSTTSVLVLGQSGLAANNHIYQGVNQALPYTYGNGDNVTIEGTVPVTGWSVSGGGSANLSSVLKTVSYSANIGDLVVASAGLNNLVVSFPDASAVSGQHLIVVKGDTGPNYVSIATTSGQTIGGRSNLDIALHRWNDRIDAYSDGTNYQISSKKETQTLYNAPGAVAFSNGAAGSYLTQNTFVTLTPGTWRLRAYFYINVGSGVAVGLTIFSGLYSADGANSGTTPSTLASGTNVKQVSDDTTLANYNASYIILPIGVSSNSRFPGGFIETIVTIAGGNQAVYAVPNTDYSSAGSSTVTAVIRAERME